MQNYLILHEFLHLFSAGVGTYMVKSLLGTGIEKFTINYLGTRRGQYA
jgi:hypothetical protein